MAFIGQVLAEFLNTAVPAAVILGAIAAFNAAAQEATMSRSDLGLQHADIPDGFSFHGVPRYYRQALAGLERAIEHFQQEQVSFAVHLGDVSGLLW